MTFRIVDHPSYVSAAPDNSIAVQATIDAAIAAGGGTVQVPNEVVQLQTAISGSLQNIIIEGESPRQSVLRENAPRVSIFVGSMDRCKVRDLGLVGDRAPLFEPAVMGQTTFENCTFSVWDHSIFKLRSATIENRWIGCLFNTTSAAVPAFDCVHGTNNEFIMNVIENSRCVSNGLTAPFFHIEAQTQGSWNYDNTFRNLNFEVCAYGGIHAVQARGFNLVNCKLYDTPTLQDDFIKISGGTLRSIQNRIQSSGRVGGSGGFYDINLVASDQTHLDSCESVSPNLTIKTSTSNNVVKTNTYPNIED